ncbi:Alpha-tocopherol transfer protein [Eumeta japonica]|uniref:Alpha-tocopherol transfer protein n=1 Tax=Eumeta variegata TaxID=151549 RepID=A0A4C1UF59_EUMVA|nr:Alpha-tocopherol transfer protein [Eumeta japonica]
MEDEERLRDGVAALGEWCDKQHHFVEKNINKIILEKCLILSKGSVEDTKMAIDRILTTRGMMEDLVLKRTPEEMKRACQVFAFTPLPKLNPMDQTRVTINKFLTKNADDIDIIAACRLGILVTEYCHTYDYSVDTRYVFDLKNMNLSILAKLNPAVLKKVEVLAAYFRGVCESPVSDYCRHRHSQFQRSRQCVTDPLDRNRWWRWSGVMKREVCKVKKQTAGRPERELSVVDALLRLNSEHHRATVKYGEAFALKNVYGLKIKGLHLVNAPSFVDKVVFLFKTILSRKLAERIHVHSSYEDFHKHVSREVLPSDYGGEERSLDELHGRSRHLLERGVKRIIRSYYSTFVFRDTAMKRGGMFPPVHIPNDGHPTDE